MSPNPPLHTPLTTLPSDHHVPELAPAVLTTINYAYDSETVRLAVETMAWIASEEMILN